MQPLRNSSSVQKCCGVLGDVLECDRHAFRCGKTQLAVGPCDVVDLRGDFRVGSFHPSREVVGEDIPRRAATVASQLSHVPHTGVVPGLGKRLRGYCVTVEASRAYTHRARGVRPMRLRIGGPSRVRPARCRPDTIHPLMGTRFPRAQIAWAQANQGRIWANCRSS